MPRLGGTGQKKRLGSGGNRQRARQQLSSHPGAQPMLTKGGPGQRLGGEEKALPAAKAKDKLGVCWDKRSGIVWKATKAKHQPEKGSIEGSLKRRERQERLVLGRKGGRRTRQTGEQYPGDRQRARKQLSSHPGVQPMLTKGERVRRWTARGKAGGKNTGWGKGLWQ